MTSISKHPSDHSSVWNVSCPTWTAPSQSPPSKYSRNSFEVAPSFPKPTAPPTCALASRLPHPNVSRAGFEWSGGFEWSLCLDLLEPAPKGEAALRPLERLLDRLSGVAATARTPST